MELLNDSDVASRLAKLEGWTREGDSISKVFELAGFPDAIAFVVKVGFAAEAVDHHPEILLRYRRVTLTLSTHEAGGLTDKDFQLAEMVDAL